MEGHIVDSWRKPFLNPKRNCLNSKPNDHFEDCGNWMSLSSLICANAEFPIRIINPNEGAVSVIPSTHRLQSKDQKSRPCTAMRNGKPCLEYLQDACKCQRFAKEPHRMKRVPTCTSCFARTNDPSAAPIPDNQFKYVRRPPKLIPGFSQGSRPSPVSWPPVAKSTCADTVGNSLAFADCA